MKKKKLEEKQGIPENERSLKRTGEVKITTHPGKKKKLQENGACQQAKR